MDTIGYIEKNLRRHAWKKRPGRLGDMRGIFEGVGWISV
jgi:hypothetical protein